MKIPNRILNNRSGFTLIEMLIVVMIVSVLSVVAFNSYKVVSARVAFQNQLSQVQFWSNELRSLTVVYNHNEEREDHLYSLNFMMKNLKLYKMLNDPADEDIFKVDGPGDQILDEYDYNPKNNLQNKLIIKSFYYRDETTPIFLGPYYEGNLAITFDNKTGNCSLVAAKSDGALISNISMIKIPVLNSDSTSGDADRFIYFHTKACNLEILNIDIK